MANQRMITALAVLSSSLALVPGTSVGEVAATERHANALAIRPAAPVPAEAHAVIAFWRDAGPGLWFAKDPAFDRTFRERFLSLYESAAKGELDGWVATPEGALALMVLLDQFPRNAFRSTPRMYATDAAALRIADAAVGKGVEGPIRMFFYLPFGHSETLADQERSVALAEGLGEPSVTHARHHRDIIKRFGRFPHRNPLLGRAMTADEQRYLDEGGFRG